MKYVNLDNKNKIIIDHIALVSKVLNKNWKMFFPLREIQHNDFLSQEYNEIRQEGLLALVEAVTNIEKEKKEDEELGAYLGRKIKSGVIKKLEAIKQRQQNLVEYNNDLYYRREEEEEYLEERRAKLKAAVKSVLGMVTPQQKLILENIYGISGEGTKNNSEAGRSLGLSRERIRVIHKKAINRLRIGAKNKKRLLLQPFIKRNKIQES